MHYWRVFSWTKNCQLTSAQPVHLSLFFFKEINLGSSMVSVSRLNKNSVKWVCYITFYTRKHGLAAATAACIGLQQCVFEAGSFLIFEHSSFPGSWSYERCNTLHGADIYCYLELKSTALEDCQFRCYWVTRKREYHLPGQPDETFKIILKHNPK